MNTWQTIFDTTPAQESNDTFEKIPSGEYQATIEKASVNESSQYGPRVELEFKICDGKFINRKLWSNYSLTAQGVAFLKKDLKTLGQEVSTAQALEGALGAITGSKVEVFIKYKTGKNKATGADTEFMSVFVNGLLGKQESSDSLPF